MARFSKYNLVSAVLLLVLASSLEIFSMRTSVAQEQKRPSLPLPEMQRLSKLYVGRWEYTETYPKSGAANTGVYTSELGPGGNSIFNHFHSKGPAGEFEGALIMTWDAKEKAYKSYTFGDGFPGALVSTGQWEGDVLVYHSEISAGAMKIVLRNVTKFLDGGKLTSDQFSSANGGPETLLVHVEAVKK
jgi:hypothetical protein